MEPPWSLYPDINTHGLCKDGSPAMESPPSQSGSFCSSRSNGEDSDEESVFDEELLRQYQERPPSLRINASGKKERDPKYHCLMERLRRRNTNNTVKRLRKVLLHPPAKNSMIHTIHAAVNDIQHFQYTRMLQAFEISQLRQQRSRLQAHLKALIKMEETRLGSVPVQTAHMGTALLQQPALYAGVSTGLQRENTQVAYTKATGNSDVHRYSHRESSTLQRAQGQAVLISPVPLRASTPLTLTPNHVPVMPWLPMVPLPPPANNGLFPQILGSNPNVQITGSPHMTISQGCPQLSSYKVCQLVPGEPNGTSMRNSQLPFPLQFQFLQTQKSAGGILPLPTANLFQTEMTVSPTANLRILPKINH